jgi:hypothetical protein
MIYTLESFGELEIPSFFLSFFLETKGKVKGIPVSIVSGGENRGGNMPALYRQFHVIFGSTWTANTKWLEKLRTTWPQWLLTY